MKTLWRAIKHSERGQALLIMVLLMAVALTIGLAVVSRSVTDIRISRQEEQSARVFSAAEAGIEEALKPGAPLGEIRLDINDINVVVKSADQGGTPEFAFPEEINQGDTQTIWLIGHFPSGDLDPTSGYSPKPIKVYWGNGESDLGGDGNCVATPNSVPALEITDIYNNGGFKVARYALDPDSTRATSCNRFDSSGIGTLGYTIAGKRFKYQKEILLPTGTSYALRLKLLYNTTRQALGVEGVGGNIPNQGKCYESTANDPQTGATNRVQQCQFYKAPPGIFDYVLFSDQNLAK